MATTAVRTLADVRADMQAMQAKLSAARDSLAEAIEIGERLYGEASAAHEPFDVDSMPRFAFEVMHKLGALIDDAGGEGNGDAGDFDLDRLPDDARDLIDLFDFAVRN